MFQNETSFPIRPIIYGSLISIGIIILLSLIANLLTEFGWSGIIQWSENLFLSLTYLGVIAGSILAGLKSREQGWLTGMGSGIFSLVWVLILAVLIGNSIHWGYFLVKLLISGFIGTFGGIIGVNLSGNRF
ncbi:MAG: TIGR04086 family membrane protein [Firmicutes bacterium]|nr:TIGR04086 family membrane protein [Bacillota bacterium]